MLTLKAMKRDILAIKKKVHQNNQVCQIRPQLPLGQWCIHYLTDHFDKAFCRFHEELIAELESLQTQRDQRNCRIAPRGGGKSHILTFAYPLRNALEGIEPFQLIASESVGLAVDRIREIREELQGNPLLREDYGDLCEPGRVWREDDIQLKNGCRIKALGQAGRIRGIKMGKQRISLFLGDDLEGEEHAISPTKRKRSMQWMQKAVLKAGQPGTNFVVIGSAIHPECLVLELKKYGWSHKIYPALEAMPDRMDLWQEWKAIRDNWSINLEERVQQAREFYEANKADMDAGAVSYWPEQFSLERLMTEWATDIGSFNTEMMGIPYDPSMVYFDPMYFEDSEQSSIWFDKWPDDQDTVLKLVCLDPSLGETTNGDYQAIVDWRIDNKGQEYVDAWLNREDVPALARRCIEVCRHAKPHEFCLEANGFQRLLKPDMEREAKSQGLIILPIHGLVEHLKWDKGTRIEQLSSPLHRRKIKFRLHSPGVAMLIQQLKEYPFAAHDDGPDCLSLVRFRAMQIFPRVG